MCYFHYKEKAGFVLGGFLIRCLMATHLKRDTIANIGSQINNFGYTLKAGHYRK